MTSQESISQTCLETTDQEQALLQSEELLSIDFPLLHHMYYTTQVTHLGQEIDFSRKPWQVGYLQDDSQTKYLKKSSQCGATMPAIVEMIYLGSQGIPGLYTLPTDDFRNEFVTNRIDMLISRVEAYRNTCGSASGKKSADNKKMKSFFGTHWKIVGAKNVHNFYEFPAGAIFIDENDLCDQDNLEYAYDRLGNEENPIVRRFGNPSFKNIGIDRLYNTSTGNVWMIKCQACNEWQELFWLKNFVRQTDEMDYVLISPRGICSKCERERIDRLGIGCWVSTHPDREAQGYHVSKLFGDSRRHVNGKDPIQHLYDVFIEAIYNPSKLQRFQNNDLGLAFDHPGSRITEEMLDKLTGKRPATKNRPEDCTSIIAGVDVGAELHVHIEAVINGSGMNELLWAGTCNSFEDLDLLLNSFGVECCCIDAQPEVHSVKQFIEKNPYCYRVRYVENTKEMRIDYENHNEIQVDRTQSIDANFQAFTSGKIILPRDWRGLDGGQYVAQMTAPNRKKAEMKKRTGLVEYKYVWDEAGQPDHHFHASNYARIATRIYGGGGSLVTVY